MNSVHCPMCAEEVKPAAKICRHCGHFFTREESDGLLGVRADASDKRRRGGLVAGAIIIGLMAYFSQVKETGVHPSPSPFAIKDGAEANLRHHLLDGNAARLGDSFVSGPAPDKLILCGNVNAPNAFGGYVGFKRFMANANMGGLVLIEGEEGADIAQIDGFNNAWRELCSSPIKSFVS